MRLPAPHYLRVSPSAAFEEITVNTARSCTDRCDPSMLTAQIWPGPLEIMGLVRLGS